MKKLIALLMFVTMFLSTMSLAYAQADQASSWAEEAITFMESENAVPQTLLGGYKTAITRSEFASLIVKVVESKLNTSLPYDSNVFTDTNAMDINKAYKLKIVNGVGNQRFNPDGLIKREEIAIMFVNTLKALDELEPSKEHLVKTTFEPYFNDADLISSWALSSIQLAYNNGIISGVGNDSFNPKGSATREQAIVIAHKVWTNLDNEDHIPSLKLKFAGNLLDPPIVESQQSEEQTVTVDLESALKERFEYNGRYYPEAYWNGDTEEEAKANFIKHYNLAFKKGNDLASANAYIEYLTTIRMEESVYESITKDILVKYPILFKGTPEQKKQRQLEQILELNRWFVFNTDYEVDFSGTIKNDNTYGMFFVMYDSVPSIDQYAYGALDMDKYIAEVYRTTTEPVYTNIDMEYKTDAVKASYKKYHDVQLKGVVELQKYFKTTDPTFTEPCVGYAQVFYRVARQMGIDTSYISTTTHMWNIVRFADGSIIHFDETQADQGFQEVGPLPMTGRMDSRKQELRDKGRLIDMGTSQDRLSKVLEYSTNGKKVGYSITVPTGDAWAVFGTREVGERFHSEFDIDKGNEY